MFVKPGTFCVAHLCLKLDSKVKIDFAVLNTSRGIVSVNAHASGLPCSPIKWTISIVRASPILVNRSPGLKYVGYV